MASRDETLLLGEDHPDYGVVEVRAQRDGASACAITVGTDPHSPSLRHKARADVPNEDGLLLVDEGARTLLAVSDGHHGHEASHGVLRRAAKLARDGVPGNPLELLELIHDCAGVDDGAGGSAAASLLIAVWDRETGRGFGASFADSTLVVIPAATSLDPWVGWNEVAANVRNAEFVSPWIAESLDPRRAREFAFEAQAGDVVVAFTDGVDGCHHGYEVSSVRPSHVAQCWERAGGDVGVFVRGVMGCAMDGVEGNPGGQDNVAVAATLA